MTVRMFDLQSLWLGCSCYNIVPGPSSPEVDIAQCQMMIKIRAKKLYVWRVPGGPEQGDSPTQNRKDQIVNLRCDLNILIMKSHHQTAVLTSSA